MPTRYQWIMLALILALGAATRIARSRFECLTFDEQWQLELSTGRGSYHVSMPSDVLIPDAPATTSLKDAAPWPAIWTHITYAVHPPLYFMALRIWRNIFGEGDFAARAFSIACSLGAIILMFQTGREMNGVEPALWAALIFAAAPTEAWIAQEVRGYALLQLLGMATVLACVRLKNSAAPSVGRSVVLGVMALSMMLTHYYALGAMAAVGLFVLIELRGRVRACALAALLAAAIVYAIIWLPHMLAQRKDIADADVWVMETASSPTAAMLVRLITWPWRLIVGTGLSQPWPYLSGLLFVIPLLVMRRRRGLVLWYLWMVCTLGFVGVLDLVRGTGNFQYARYVVQAAPAVCMLFTSLLSLLPAWFSRSLAAMAAAGAIAFSRASYFQQELDWSLIGKTLDEHVLPGEVIIFDHVSSPAWMHGIDYLAAAHYSRLFPRSMIELSRPASGPFLQQFSGQTAWLVTVPRQENVSLALPGATVLEQHDLPAVATCSRVRLAATVPATNP